MIEACGLLADGAEMVLLVASDCQLPELFLPFQECDEQPHAWAWLMTAPADGGDAISLRWSASDEAPSSGMPGGLAVAAFHLGGASRMERCDGRMRWSWSRDA